MNKIMYLLNYVGDGGSEKYVLDLIQSIDPKRCVLVYSTPGPFLHKFEKLNIPIYRIEMHHPFDIQAARKLKKIEPPSIVSNRIHLYKVVRERIKNTINVPMLMIFFDLSIISSSISN